MNDFPLAVREKAAQRMNDAGGMLGHRATADNISTSRMGRALCKAVQDGCLHWDAGELDRARWEEACRLAGCYSTSLLVVRKFRELVISGWTPPEPVDPVEALCNALGLDTAKDYAEASAALDKLGLKIVKDGQ